MKKLLGCVIAASLAYIGTAHAVPSIQGYSDNTTITQDGDLWTFIFDEGGSSNVITAADGLFFQQGDGPRLNVTSNTGSVNQDLGPSNGGLGVTGGDTGDNLSTGEWLNFDLGGQQFDLMAIIFNNGAGTVHEDQFLAADKLGTGDGSCDAARVVSAGGSLADCASDVDQFSDTSWLNNGYAGNFTDITSFRVEEFDQNLFQFSGYVEAIRLRIADITDIPEPSIIALMGIGLVGFGFARRRELRVA